MKHNRRLMIGTWITIIAIWAIVTQFNIVDSALLPSPYQVIVSFIDILKNGYASISLGEHLGSSFYRLFVSLFFAILLGVPTGLLSGLIPQVRGVVDSVVQFIRPLPPLAYYTLLILWLGIGNESKIALLFLAGFAPIYLACVDAIKTIDPSYVLQARSLGASRWQNFWHVVFPTCLPNIFTGIRTSAGFTYTTLVSAEMVAANKGIGWMVIDASRYLLTDVMFVGIILMGITGLALDAILRLIEERVVFWQQKGQSTTDDRSSKKFAKLKKYLVIGFWLIIFAIIAFDRDDTDAIPVENQINVGLLRVPNDEILAKAGGILDENFEKMGYKVNYSVFDSGVDANKALASGDIDFASMGYTNGIIALSRNIDVELVWIHEILGKEEALVVRDSENIKDPSDLEGKTIATIFGSTSHYSLMKYLEANDLEDKVELLDMNTQDIVSAWKRGDISAAYTWQPTLDELLEEGSVLVSSEDIAEMGAPTANILLARKAFASENPELASTFIDSLTQANKLLDEDYDKAVSLLSKELGLDDETIKIQLEGSMWLKREEFLSKDYAGTNEQPGAFIDNMKNTADFLASGRFINRNVEYEEIDEFVNTSYANPR